MAFEDYGLINLGSFTRGLAPAFPGSMVFGTGSQTFSGSNPYMTNEWLRKVISWSWNGNDPQGEVLFSGYEAVGSVINEVGISDSSSLGSNLWARDIAAVGSKNPNSSLDILFTVRFRRL